ncbi:MAG TPA: TonB-dependent receptor [Gemmatimonadales bacterium]|jgi:Fe(3+) dicitrate transport protein
MSIPALRRSARSGLLGVGALLLCCPALHSQSAVSGTVRDAATATPVAAAQVTVLPLGVWVLTDLDGTFRFPSSLRGAQRVRVTRVGYAPWEDSLPAGPAPLTIRLTAQPTELAGITVIGVGAGSLTRLPGAAHTVDAAQLRLIRPLSGNDVFRTLPGVHVQEEEGLGFRANIGIRGLDPDRSRTVLMLEDGIPVALNPYGEPEMYYTPPIDRMERVEVIKGSGSILFGPQTVGGVVNYVTADPPAQPEGRLELVGGSGTFLKGRLAYGGTWSGAGFALTALRRQADDLRGLNFGQTDVTLKSALHVSPRSALGLKVGVYDESSNATYVGLTDSMFRANPDFYPGADDLLAIRRYTASLSHDVGVGEPVGLRTTAYAYQTSRDWSRQDYRYTPSGNAIEFLGTTGNRNRRFEVGGIESRVRLASGLGELEGGVRAHYERARDQHINGGTATARTGEIRDDEVRTGHALAAFVQHRFQAGPRVRVTPGIRLEYFAHERHILRTRVRREVLDENGDVIGTTRLPEDVDLRSRDDMVEVIPGIGASWFVGSAATVFAGVHRGFAPPRVKDAFVLEDPVLPPEQQPGVPVSLELDAERSWNMEVGTRTQPLYGVRFDVTGFWLEFSNQIVEPSLSAGSVAQAALANQGATRHRGVEASLGVDWGAVAGWGFTLRTDVGYTFADARFSRERLLVQAGDTVDIEGNRLPYAPRHLLTLAGTLGFRNGLQLRVDGLRASDQFADNFETREGTPNGRNGLIPSYAVWNASATWDLPRTPVSVVASVKNLLGREYISSRRPEGIKPGLPRHIQAGIEWQF